MSTANYKTSVSILNLNIEKGIVYTISNNRLMWSARLILGLKSGF